MDLLPAAIRTPLAFVVVLGVLVFIHELGHYLAARWRGVHAEVFSVGFGRALARWTDRRGTEWRIGWLPLGGYVKLHGMEEPTEGAPPEERARWRPGQTFHDKPVRDRAIVIAAGPFANFALAALLFAGIYATVGRPGPSTQVASVAAGSAAERAGVLQGDRLLALDGTPVRRFEDVQRHVQPRAGVPIEIRLEREGRELALTVTPEAAPRPEGAPPGASSQPVGRLGIGGAAAALERLDPFSALWAGVAQTWNVTAQTLVGLWEMISGSRGTEELGGPLRIAQLSGQVAELGASALVSFMAILSVNLALINLFPIPILDGGHLVFQAAEAIRGRPLPPRAVEYGMRAGLALLAALFVFATWNDLAQLGVVRWFANLAG